MDDVLERLAQTLGVADLTAAEQELLLACARDVAHGSQRRYAPLATFLVGVAAGRSEVERETAVRDSVERVQAIVAADGPTGHATKT